MERAIRGYNESCGRIRNGFRPEVREGRDFCFRRDELRLFRLQKKRSFPFFSLSVRGAFSVEDL